MTRSHQRLESALQLNQMSYISWLFKVLLQFLTNSKAITQDNWADAFRFQWSLRAIPAVQPLLGTEEDPIPWESLNILEKRVNPAGWDRQGNTYWLFDDNRMWIQRVPPKAASKAKSKPPTKKQKTAKKASKPPPRPRPAGRRSSRLSGSYDAVPESEKAEEVFDSDSELSQPPEDASEWIDFETICITKSEWIAFCERFATSKHPDERSLYNYISKEVLPKILEVIQSEEKKAALEAALSNRKRSSRIALRDSEREQREREEMELREQRARAQAALQAERERAAREEAEAAARRTREDRMRERQERILIRERMLAKRQEAWQRSEEGSAKDAGISEPSAPIEINKSAEQSDKTDVSHAVPPSAPQELPADGPPRAEQLSDATPVPEPGPHLATSGLGISHFSSMPTSMNGPNMIQTAPESQGVSQPKDSFVPPMPSYTFAPTSPQNKSPRGSFPLRTQLLGSPLSRSVELTEKPAHLSVGNSIHDSDSSPALRESPAQPPPT
ncbi:DNA-directed RNA polymerase [Malassezia caprae]|uniref:DNA-directed RNA polymerase n=1 Tax=Malassezia caprae TaxID=1381934 RepID=A0AAF0E6B2_9BASI|nr:DNA-directed RNA polymerase [Malassezia caprae]